MKFSSHATSVLRRQLSVGSGLVRAHWLRNQLYSTAYSLLDWSAFGPFAFRGVRVRGQGFPQTLHRTMIQRSSQPSLCGVVDLNVEQQQVWSCPKKSVIKWASNASNLTQVINSPKSLKITQELAKRIDTFVSRAARHELEFCEVQRWLERIWREGTFFRMIMIYLIGLLKIMNRHES